MPRPPRVSREEKDAGPSLGRGEPRAAVTTGQASRPRGQQAAHGGAGSPTGPLSSWLCPGLPSVLLRRGGPRHQVLGDGAFCRQEGAACSGQWGRQVCDRGAPGAGRGAARSPRGGAGRGSEPPEASGDRVHEPRAATLKKHRRLQPACRPRGVCPCVEQSSEPLLCRHPQDQR